MASTTKKPLPTPKHASNPAFYDDISDMEDDVTEQPKSKPGPGAYRTKGKYTIHTKAAHRLFYGRKKAPGVEPIIGLVQFSSRVNAIWQASELDDPYADSKLLAIEEALDHAQKLVEASKETLEGLLGSDTNIEIFPAETIRPETVDVEFKTPYGFLALKLLSTFDGMVQNALAARHAAMIFNNDWQQLVTFPSRKIRHAFALSDFRFSGSCRNDFAANNQRARDAVEKYGQLDPDILQGKRRPRMAPEAKRMNKAT
ncbi:PFL_4669 family integrating conjugative element protein [Hahella ganghwensis]|uniref:PFL_4669 family integrating conjugative element protein n=1 Tax=Hahella ganghwensis TaxID=286420 RepID=UPI00037CE0D3|nr:TIGR03761 family integrating conjugative element protein [Hahella ganghwensis]